MRIQCTPLGVAAEEAGVTSLVAVIGVVEVRCHHSTNCVLIGSTAFKSGTALQQDETCRNVLFCCAVFAVLPNVVGTSMYVFIVYIKPRKRM